MAKEYSKKFYASSIWHKTKNSYLKSKNYICERCIKKGLFNKAEIVHHKTHLAEDNINNTDISINFNNLEALCLECHNKEHFAKYKNYYFTADGELLPPKE